MIDINNIQVKAFVGHSRGLSYADGADRIGVDVRRGRFCVADGVSQSHLSNVWAGIVTDSFISSDESAEQWGKRLDGKRLTELCDTWSRRNERLMATASPRERKRMERTYRNFGRAATTVAGITIGHDGSMDFCQLGDSCIFLVDMAGTAHPMVDISEFGYAPDYVDTAGVVKGKMATGRDYALGVGYILLMTDALSDWFIERQRDDASVVGRLWELRDHEDFWRLVESERDAYRLKDDDVALIVIKVLDRPARTQLLYCDDIDRLIAAEAPETPEAGHAPEPGNAPEPAPKHNVPDSFVPGHDDVDDTARWTFTTFVLAGLLVANAVFALMHGCVCLFSGDFKSAYWPMSDGTYAPSPVFQLNFAYNALVFMGLYVDYWFRDKQTLWQVF